MKKIFLSLCIVCCSLVCAGLFAFHIAQSSMQALAADLKKQNIQETVFIGSDLYLVDRGVVSFDNEEVSGLAAWQPLRLAYAVAAAERTPLFALPGVDPQNLREAALHLDVVQKQLASLEKNKEDHASIAKLYPIHFLLALAQVEEARQSFITHPSGESEQVYERATAEALRTKIDDLREFSSTFNFFVGTTSKVFAGLGGSISTASMQKTLASFGQDISQEKKIFAAYVACQKNIFAVCKEISPISVSVPPTTTGGISTTTQDVLSFWSDVYGEDMQHARVFLVSESKCLSSLAAPYAFTFQKIQSKSGVFTMPHYVGDIFFISTNVPNAPFLQYEKGVLGMDYTVSNPFKYYTCAEVGEDVGHLFALRSIVNFATAHPSVAPVARAQLLRTPQEMHEAEVLLYLNKVLNESTASSTDRRDIQELALMVERRTGGLADLIHDIALVMDIDAQLYSGGAPIDISPNTLFITHSAFPSLLRIGDTQSTSIEQLRSSVSEHTEATAVHLKNYSILVKNFSREKLLKDARAFLRLEGRF